MVDTALNGEDCPMHIVYPCNEYPPQKSGGIGTAVATLARGMAAAGHRVTAIGLYDQSEPVVEDQGVAIRRLRMPRTNRLTRWWVARRQLYQALLELHRREPIDVIEWPDYQGWYWKSIPGVCDIVKVHGTLMSHRIHGFHKRIWEIEQLELRTLRNILNWIGVSQWFNDEWKRIARVTPRRETVVYNPVDIQVFHPSHEQDDRLVLYAGGLKRRKGVEALSRAAQIFLRAVPDSRLVLIGFPADMSEAEVRAEAGPVGDRLEFIPFMAQAELARIMAKAAVYAMPSLYESCGNTWVEAAASGVPAVGSTLSCGPEIVLDGQTGLLADPHNPQDIADKVVRLLRDRDLRQQLGHAGQERAKAIFSVEAGVRESEAFYRMCIQDSTTR